MAPGVRIFAFRSDTCVRRYIIIYIKEEVAMSWSISVLENTLSLNDSQRAGLAPILERRGA